MSYRDKSGYAEDDLSGSFKNMNLSATSADIKELRAFLRKILQIKCAGCKAQLLTEDVAAGDQLKLCIHEKVPAWSTLACRKCKTYTCMGCGEPVKQKPSNRVSSKQFDITWCCNEGCLFALWLAVINYEEVAYELSEESAKRIHQRRQYETAYGRSGQRDMSRYGYYNASARGTAKGTGLDYGSVFNSPAGPAITPRLHKDQQTSYVGRKDRLDEKTRYLCDMFSELIPAACQSSTQQCAIQMITSSGFMDRLVELLRNDSMDDITKRSALYQNVFAMTRNLFKNLCTASLILGERKNRPSGVALYEITWGYDGGQGKWKDETSPPLSTYLQNLVTQSDATLQNYKYNKSEFSSSTGQAEIEICQQISSLGRELEKITGGVQKRGSTKNKSYEQWHRETCCLEVSEEELTSHYFWYNDANVIGYSKPGRIKRIISEIANMKTSLPEGIWVRYGESRVDMMRALIAAPWGTPYEGTIHDFHIMFPPDYPNSPPIVSWRTVCQEHYAYTLHGDRFAHYGRGKNVCLSILGTWGEGGWISNTSTLLQVLISIQSMVFAEDAHEGPIPSGVDSFGRYRLATARRSEGVKAMSIQGAMTPWLTTGKGDHDMWGHTAFGYWHFKGKEIMRTAWNWANDNSNLVGYYNELDQTVEKWKTRYYKSGGY